MDDGLVVLLFAYCDVVMVYFDSITGKDVPGMRQGQVEDD
ncbi:hypothetical protein GCM10025794_36090 [Massilia kyonggiensis]